MITPQTNVDLQARNTLAVPSRAQYFLAAESPQMLREALAWAQQRQLPVSILGGGSNVLLAEHIPGLVLTPDIRGRAVLADDGDAHRNRTSDATPVRLRFGAGENWHEVVQWTLTQGFYGLENLALIPGSMGAAPVQNIGAYGVEICQFLESVEAIDRTTGGSVSFTREQCQFGYRDSLFKQAGRERYIITWVTLRLRRTPQTVVDYPALQAALKERERRDAHAVFNAVCQLRQQKLPDPQLTPNAGSFFKNPIIPTAQFQALQQTHPDIAAFDVMPPLDPQQWKKIAAAWLIDRAGWKGRDIGGVAVHPHQALVLTNPQGLPAARILSAAAEIQHSVQRQFGLALELEPQALGPMA